MAVSIPASVVESMNLSQVGAEAAKLVWLVISWALLCPRLLRASIATISLSLILLPSIIMQRRNRSGALKGGVATVLPLLRAINSAADVFPPLKSAVSIALWIGDTVVVSCDLHYVVAVQRVKGTSGRHSNRIRKIGPILTNTCSNPLNV